MLHQRTHPNLDVPGCFSCRIATVNVAPSATPSRHPEAASVKAREERWAKDLPAYKRLRQNGLQPRSTEGAARLEALAESPAQVELGLVNVPQSHRSQVDELPVASAETMGGAA